MRLKSADISNFRSIAELKIRFDPGCQILLGVNESGKSNILRALHLLDPATKVQPSDLRIERHDEQQVTSGRIRFVFELSEEELLDIFSAVRLLFEPSSLIEPLVDSGHGAWTLLDFCKYRNEGLHIVKIPAGTRSNTTWSIPQTLKIFSNWARNKTAEAIDFVFDAKKLTIPGYGFFSIDDSVSLPGEQFERATVSQVSALVNAQIVKLIAEKLPKCVFWRYADEYLLPSSIDINAFCASPDSCIPLKSMFELAGFQLDTLQSTILKTRQQGHYRYVQILERTASAATDHIRSVWKDNNTIRLRLEANGETLSPIIVDDQVPLDMVNRSDGFKRFVSFLLQISAKVRTSELKGALILVDEPEIALHPSGSRNLMRELIQIGETNATIYSTHSIFMIDKDRIDRHLVVEKIDEVTTTWRAETSRIQDEEVLYSAIGYSVFETLKQNNIIFEGWRDKKIFSIVRDAMIKSNQELKLKFSAIGLTHAAGVKDVKNIAQFLELASRPCLIISDADAPAFQHKRLYETPGSWGTWKTLQDILGPGAFVTAEDLISRSVVVKKANKFRHQIEGLNPISDADFLDGRPTIDVLSTWLKSGVTENNLFQQKLNDLKSALFDGLKRADVNDKAELLVEFVAAHEFCS